MVRLAVQLGGLVAKVRVRAWFDTAAAAAETCDAPVATGLIPKGVWL
jgi:hypothetical protein